MVKLHLRQRNIVLPHVNVMTVLVICCMLICAPAQALAEKRSVIIGYKHNSQPHLATFLHKKKARIRHTFHHIRALSAEIPEESLDDILSNANVAYVEEDFVVALIEPMATSSEYDNSWGVRHIGAESVHQLPVTGSGAKIAVLDTGINYNHPDLFANYRQGFDFVYNDDDPFDDSWNRHGTHVAGIIASVLNDQGVVGVAPDASLYAVKVLEGSGFGMASWLIAGLEWVVANDMDIANLSIGFTQYSQAMEDACTYATENGVLLVAAAGNASGGAVTYPAAFSSVIAVTGTDPLDQSGFFAPLAAEVELAAPGVAIYSTSRNDSYEYLSGTSQAAPHVSGAAALLIEAGLRDFNKDGMISHADIRRRLIDTATDLGVEGRDEEFGYGLINVAQAIDYSALDTGDCIALTVFLNSYGLTSVDDGFNPACDFNKDNDIDGLDLSELM